MSHIAIRFENVSKRFRLYHQKHYSLKESVLNLFRDRGRWEEFWALKAIDIEVPAGQMLGIIGENGSGKSTCLKLLARILVPDTGSVTAQGSVSALIELGAGFQPDFTGRENVYLNGSILGFTRKEVDERFDDIVRFAELERFIDTPVKTYSSGMYMRLGFSIATHVDPDILLIDEILAVGDEPFQEKCLERIQQFRQAGKTIVFVSHALGAVENLCDRAVLLSKGRLVADALPGEAIECYRRILGMATQTQVLTPMPSPEHARSFATEGEDLQQQVRTLCERMDWLDRRISAPMSVENAFQRIVQLETSMGVVHRQGETRDQALRDLNAKHAALEGQLAATGHREVTSSGQGLSEAGVVGAELPERLAWLERRISGPISVENVQERLVQLEDTMGVVHQQDATRDGALGDLTSRILQLESRIATFLAEGTAMVPRQYGTRAVELVDVVFFNSDGKETTHFRSGDSLVIRIKYRVRSSVRTPVVGIAFADQRGAVVFGSNTQIDDTAADLRGNGEIEIVITRLVLLAGLFYVTIAAHSADHAVQYHRLENCYSIQVEPRRGFDGKVDMECRWRVVANRE
ncbi:ABC transporter ATP-binding protein [Candidatus Fermentibacteria bacterium]|nr:ABC transporter ATP-binding protein [Candidatus Fermentibacteria bacterium]